LGQLYQLSTGRKVVPVD